MAIINHSYQVMQRILDRVNTGIKAAAIHLSGRVKELISVPAPRVITYGPTGIPRYIAGWKVPKNPGKTNQRWTAISYHKNKSTGQWTRKEFAIEPSFATPGAPPRKLSGQLRRSIAWEIRNMGATARVGTNVIYARRLEATGHPYLSLSLQLYKAELRAILGRVFTTGGNV